MKEKTVFLGRICRKISLGDTRSPWQASLSYGFTSSELGLASAQEDEQMKGCLKTELPQAHTCSHSLQECGLVLLQRNSCSGVLTSDQRQCLHLAWWEPGTEGPVWAMRETALSEGRVPFEDVQTCDTSKATIGSPPRGEPSQNLPLPGKGEVDPGKMCPLTVWDGLTSQTSWCGKRDSTHIMYRMCTHIMCRNVW